MIECLLIKCFHVRQQSSVLIAPERADALEIGEFGYLPVVVIVDVVPEKELSPAVVGHHDVTECFEDGAMVQAGRMPERDVRKLPTVSMIRSFARMW